MIAEKAKEKAKQLEHPVKPHEGSEKHYRKNLFRFREESSNQLNQILITPQVVNPEQIMQGEEQLFDEQEVSVEGFFPCPACTCWFTNKKDLKFHTKNWCGQ
jgi:hypothetical protein